MLSKSYGVVVATTCFAASIPIQIEAYATAKTLLRFQARSISGRPFPLKSPRGGLYQAERGHSPTSIESIDYRTRTPQTNSLHDISSPWSQADFIQERDEGTGETEIASILTPEESVGSSSIDTESTLRKPLSSRSQVVTTAFVGLTGLVIAAELGILPGPYTDALIVRDFLSTITTAAAAFVLVQIFTTATERGVLESRDSRKLIHTLSGPLFILTWPAFSQAVSARLFCAVVPLLNAVRLWKAANGHPSSRNAPNDATESDIAMAKAFSRSGDVGEARGGPFIYTLMLFTFVLLFWRNSPVGVVSLATMAAGDGMADLVGRRFGKNNKWPGSEKSVAGSLAFWIAATITSTGLLAWMNFWHCWTVPFTMEWIDIVGRLALITMASALLELVPIADDNYTVPISTAILTYFFFPN